MRTFKFFLFLTALSLLTATQIAAASTVAHPLTFKVEKGEVSYKVTTQILGGISSQTVSGRDVALSGEAAYQENRVTGKLVISVKEFKSGDTMLDEHVRGILNADKYPEILFEIIDMNRDADALKKLLNIQTGTEKISGRLTVAGVSKTFDFDLRIEQLEKNKFKLSTEKEVRFTDFGITPPSFGGFLSTAPDQVFIKGEIILMREETPEPFSD